MSRSVHPRSLPPATDTQAPAQHSRPVGCLPRIRWCRSSHRLAVNPPRCCNGGVDDRQPGVRPTAFFATTFLLSWAIWVPLMLVRLDVLPQVVPDASLTAVALLGVLMPAVAASVLTARAGGRHALRELWARLTVWRVGWSVARGTRHPAGGAPPLGSRLRRAAAGLRPGRGRRPDPGLGADPGALPPRRQHGRGGRVARPGAPRAAGPPRTAGRQHRAWTRDRDLAPPLLGAAGSARGTTGGGTSSSTTSSSWP